MRELLKRLKTMDSHTRDETSRPMGPPLSCSTTNCRALVLLFSFFFLMETRPQKRRKQRTIYLSPDKKEMVESNDIKY